ncbi:MAG: hypothetical protein ACRCYS_20375 [Beijerinckiaceae bacterium]
MAGEVRLPKEIREALAKLEPKVARAFLDAIGTIRKAADPGAIAKLIDVGDIEGAIRAMRFEASLFGPLDRALEEAYRNGGDAILAALHVVRDPYLGTRLVIGFDGRHPRAEKWARDMSSNLIVEIIKEQADMARDVIRQGIVNGVNPRETALEIVGRVNRTTGQREGGFVGLTGRLDPATGKFTGQVGWVQSAREQLEGGDYAGYMRRKLRNGTFDRTIAKAERDGKPLTKSQIDKIIRGYERKVLKYRGDNIARTETITALRAGRQEGFQQLVDSGAVSDRQIVRRWRATGDARTRDSHLHMNDLTLTGLKTPWNVAGSLMMYPGDVSLGADAGQTVNCRCFEEYRINYD